MESRHQRHTQERESISHRNKREKFITLTFFRIYNEVIGGGRRVGQRAALKNPSSRLITKFISASVSGKKINSRRQAIKVEEEFTAQCVRIIVIKYGETSRSISIITGCSKKNRERIFDWKNCNKIAYMQAI